MKKSYTLVFKSLEGDFIVNSARTKREILAEAKRFYHLSAKQNRNLLRLNYAVLDKDQRRYLKIILRKDHYIKSVLTLNRKTHSRKKIRYKTLSEAIKALGEKKILKYVNARLKVNARQIPLNKIKKEKKR